MIAGDGDGTDIGATDLFFSLAAMLIVLLCVTSLTLRQGILHGAAESEADGFATAVQEASVWLAQAGAEGVVLYRPDAEPAPVGLEEILAKKVEAWAGDARGTIWLVIAADATDSAFLLETSLSRAGVEAMRRVRLAGPCPDPRIAGEGVICGG